jgi:hypothetical protein
MRAFPPSPGAVSVNSGEPLDTRADVTTDARSIGTTTRRGQWVAHEQGSVVEHVAAARHVIDDDPGAARRPDGGLVVHVPHALAPDEPSGRPPTAVDRRLEDELLPLHRRGVDREPLDADPSDHDPPPEMRSERREHQSDAEHGERSRAHEPGAGDDTRRQRTRALEPAHTGVGVASSASATTSSTVTPVARASGARISRCASTGPAGETTPVRRRAADKRAP